MITAVILITSVLVTSIISGTLGLGGGMILMGILLFSFPVQKAMILHGIVQFASNASRAFLFKGDILWKPTIWYIAGGFVAFLSLVGASIVLPKSVLFFILGFLPLISLILPKDFFHADIGRPIHAFIGGFLLSAVQILAGVSGPLQEILYVNSKLTKAEMMGTKAITQTFGHLAKIFYYGTLSLMLETSELVLLAIIASFLGNYLGKLINNQMSEKGFKRYYKLALASVCLVFLGKGVLQFV